MRIDFPLITVPNATIIVDNSKSALNITPDSLYIPLRENKGIATAQNIGIRNAKEKGYKYIVFSDQDSVIQYDFLLSLLNEYHKIKEIDKTLGVLGPMIVDEKSDLVYKNHLEMSSRFGKVSHIISSGSIVETSIFETVGYFEDDLFIDLVDYEWCWRLRQYNRNVYMTRNVSLNHSIGNNYFKWLGIYFNISSPIRYYYQYRNSIWMLGRPYVPRSWKWKTIIRRVSEIFLLPFFSSQKCAVIKYIFRGIWDGLNHKTHML